MSPRWPRNKNLSTLQTFRYRPELDGLRAVAVLAVLFFHAQLGLPGGFVGVDVFFVLSGYLITSLINRDLETGRFTFSEFWERRVRRILPASIVLIAVTLAAGSLFLMPKDYASLGTSALATACFGANIFFWRSVDYFTTAADELPLLHMWSLAVEEQFYFVVPILLWLRSRSRRFSRRALSLFLGIAGIVSLTISAWMVPRMPAAAFYLLPSRAWELGIGSLLAFWPPGFLPASRFARAACAWLGLAGIALPCALFDESTPFPGLAALPPCLGCALFILSTTLPLTLPAPLPVRILSTPPFVAIGLVSYSLYLWHWPLFAFTRYWALEPLSLTIRMVLCALSGLAALLSWYFIETPFRTRSLAPGRLEMLTVAAVSLAVVAIAGLTIQSGDGFPRRFSSALLELTSDDLLNISAPAPTLEQLRGGRLPRLGNPDDPLTLLVWGDSHAMAILPAVEQLCRERQVSACYAVHSSTAPVVEYEHTDRYSRGQEAPDCAAAVIDYVRAQKVPNVLLAARWSGYFHDDIARANEKGAKCSPSHSTFPLALCLTVRALVSAGAKPYLLAEVPNHIVNVPKAIRARMVFGLDTALYCADDLTHQAQMQDMKAIAPALTAEGAVIIDASHILFSNETQRYCFDEQGVPLYVDRHHLSRFGAIYIRSAIARCLTATDSLPPNESALEMGKHSSQTDVSEER